jgi:hypothetical protein
VLNVEATPVAADEREPAMLNLVPLAGDDDTNGLPAWHQAGHLPLLTSNDQLMPGCIAGESRDGEAGGSCRLLWIGRKSRPFVISAMQFDETTPARRCLLQSWHGV